MEKLSRFVLAATLMLGAQGFSVSWAGDVESIDRRFVCPEALATDQARSEALKEFFGQMGAAAPQDSIIDVLKYRRFLLEKHGCRDTLARMDAAERAIRNGEVWDQAWFPVWNGHPGLFVSTNYLKDYSDPRFPGTRAIETFVKITFATPRETNVTHHAYDSIISHNIFYCQVPQYALIENDYFLADKEVFKDRSPVAMQSGGAELYQTSPLLPGSLNALAANWACQAEHGGSA